MSKVIVDKIEKGSFKFQIQFDLSETHQSIRKATFDTGCSHSLISVNSLKLDSQILDTLQHDLLTDMDVLLAIGIGVEASSNDTNKIKKYVKQINGKKLNLKNSGFNKHDAKYELEQIIPQTVEDLISKSKNIRYEYTVQNYTIDNINLGDIVVRLSFNTNNKNLIGMHIIQSLYSKIFKIKDALFLIASLDNTLLIQAEQEIRNKYADVDIEEDTEALEANYINSKL